MIKILKFLFLCLAISTLLNGGPVMADEKEIIHMTLKDGVVKIETRPDLAPKHVAQIKQLISEGQYDGVVFHRVIDGFMAQTGDVEFGNSSNDKFNMSRAGTGGSNLPNIPAEFSDANHGRGALSMARAQDPNSANSQFFICLEAAPHLDRQYSVFGKVIKGMEFVDKIKRGDPNSGAVKNPDKIISIRSK